MREYNRVGASKKTYKLANRLFPPPQNNNNNNKELDMREKRRVK